MIRIPNSVLSPEILARAMRVTAAGLKDVCIELDRRGLLARRASNGPERLVVSLKHWLDPHAYSRLEPSVGFLLAELAQRAQLASKAALLPYIVDPASYPLAASSTPDVVLLSAVAYAAAQHSRLGAQLLVERYSALPGTTLSLESLPPLPKAAAPASASPADAPAAPASASPAPAQPEAATTAPAEPASPSAPQEAPEPLEGSIVELTARTRNVRRSAAHKATPPSAVVDKPATDTDKAAEPAPAETPSAAAERG